VLKDESYGQMVLLWAVRNGHTTIVDRLLLEWDADLELRDEEDGLTPLIWAAQNGHTAVVKLLLEKEANVESKDGYSRTALSYATQNGHTAVVDLLLKRDSNLACKDMEYGSSPLSLAA
jgi:ankyrin repeat protein